MEAQNTGSKSLMQVMPPSSTGGPSRLFICPRPVATTLLMVAILLAGIIGYRFCPCRRCRSGLPTSIQVVTLYPGADPDVDVHVFSRQTSIVIYHANWHECHPRLGSAFGYATFQLALSLDVAEQERCRPPLTPPPTCCRLTCRTRRFAARSTRPRIRRS